MTSGPAISELSVGKNVGNKMDGASGAKMETVTDFAVDKDMKETDVMEKWERDTSIPVFKTPLVRYYTHSVDLFNPFFIEQISILLFYSYELCCRSTTDYINND